MTTTEVETGLLPLVGEVLTAPASEREREICRCLALGYSWEETAKVVEVSRATVARRAQKFGPYIAQARANLPDVFEQALYANLSLALDVERRMLSGEIPAKDDRYREAKEIVRRVTERLFSVERRTAERGALVPAPPAGLLANPADGEPRVS